MDGEGTQVARVSAYAMCALVDTGTRGSALLVGEAPLPQGRRSRGQPSPRFPGGELSPREHPLPALGTWQGSTSPCPVGSWAAGRPGPLPGSAGSRGPPAEPAPATACAERPSSQSGAGVWGLVAAVGQSEGGGRDRQRPLGRPLFMGLAWPSDRPLETLDGGGGRGGCVGKAQLQPCSPQGCLCKWF